MVLRQGSGDAALGGFELAGTLLPFDEKEIADIVAVAADRRTPLAVVGGGTRTRLGRPMQTAATLSTAELRGVTLYEPTELVISARAGTPLAEVVALLAENGQRLAFEPMDHRALYGTSGEPTIGAVAAANLSGPRRIQVGAARDSLIGVRAITGRGDPVKSGGRVMKNVTGYDLVKFLAGSHGTLAVLSEVTFKVLPAPETEATLVIPGIDDHEAIAALSAALGSPWSVTGAAHIPAGKASRTCVRIEGFAASVAERLQRLRGLSAPFAAAAQLEPMQSAALWQSVRDLDVLMLPPDVPLWRISVKPGDAPAVVDAIRRIYDCRVLYDWGGGLVWIAGGQGRDAGAHTIRGAVAPVGGHATLVRASDDIRNSVEVFQPLAAPAMDLSRKLKAAFDPAGILNPGRMYAAV
jgi:glycolate oxidase FAD binding subunit